MYGCDGQSIWQIHHDKKSIPNFVPTKVEEAVVTLLSEDNVFWDLRSNNIVCVPSEHRVAIVDFDWPGKNGVSRYPVTLNPGKNGKDLGLGRGRCALWTYAQRA